MHITKVIDIDRKKPIKPLGSKAYGSTPHLFGSRVGPGDYSLSEQQSMLFTGAKVRRGDRFIVTEKLDGSCVSVAKIDGNILALGRAGYLASDSPFQLHHVFHRWVEARQSVFDSLLMDGERVVAEWLHTAMGTLYDIVNPEELLIPFSIIAGKKRLPFDEFVSRCDRLSLPRAHVLSDGPGLAIEDAMSLLGDKGFHGALDGVEGAVWVHETEKGFSSIAKFVKHDKIDGRHMSGITGLPDVVNYRGHEI